ncbi:MAG: hypothetical protein IKL24_06435 [Clostridia bacterium]|nr:hypothetical protein [Clostridia bacterium]
MRRKLTKFFNIAVHVLEYLIALMTLAVLVGLIAYEIYRMFTSDGYFDSSATYLHNILTIVVGLEFVRMLINLTPANTLEVLIVAIARQVIVDHSSPVNNVVCVICIAGLFAIRKFLVSKKDLVRELSVDEPHYDEEA